MKRVECRAEKRMNEFHVHLRVNLDSLESGPIEIRRTDEFSLPAIDLDKKDDAVENLEFYLDLTLASIQHYYPDADVEGAKTELVDYFRKWKIRDDQGDIIRLIKREEPHPEG